MTSMTRSESESEMLSAALSQINGTIGILPIEYWLGKADRTSNANDMTVQRSTANKLLFLEEYFWSWRTPRAHQMLH